MTDYKHFPRLPRRSRIETIVEHTEVFKVVVVVVLLLCALAVTGREDYANAKRMDQPLTQEEKEHIVMLQQSVFEQEQARLLRHFEDRAK